MPRRRPAARKAAPLEIARFPRQNFLGKTFPRWHEAAEYARSVSGDHKLAEDILYAANKRLRWKGTRTAERALWSNSVSYIAKSPLHAREAARLAMSALPRNIHIRPVRDDLVFALLNASKHEASTAVVMQQVGKYYRHAKMSASNLTDLGLALHNASKHHGFRVAGRALAKKLGIETIMQSF